MVLPSKDCYVFTCPLKISEELHFGYLCKDLHIFKTSLWYLQEVQLFHRRTFLSVAVCSWKSGPRQKNNHQEKIR